MDDTQPDGQGATRAAPKFRAERCKPAPEPTTPLEVILEADMHFGAELYASSLATGRTAMEWEDHVFLLTRFLAWRTMRDALRGRSVTHAKDDKAGSATAAGAYLAAWGPFARLSLVSSNLVSAEVLLALPGLSVDPADYTPSHHAACGAYLDALKPRYEAWEPSVFSPSFRAGEARDARMVAVRDAWRELWSARIAPWWNEAVRVEDFKVAIRVPRDAKARRALLLAWNHKVREHRGDERAAADDIGNAAVGRSGSMRVTNDGRFVFDAVAALQVEARRQRAERQRQRKQAAYAQQVPTVSLDNHAARVLATQDLLAVRARVEDLLRVRRRDDRVTPVALAWFRRWMETGAKPEREGWASVHGVDVADLKRRIGGVLAVLREPA